MCESVADIKRLDGGCMNLIKNRKTKPNESTVDVQDQKPDSCKRKDQIENIVASDQCPSRARENGKPNSLPKIKCVDSPSAGDDVANKCDQIESLEEQMRQMNFDLNHIREQMVPSVELAKFSSLSKHLHEINRLLTELKYNCLRLQETASNDVQEDQNYCPSERIKETPVKQSKNQRNTRHTIPLYSDEKMYFTNDSFYYTEPQIRKCRRKESYLAQDFCDLPENPHGSHSSFAEPQIRECNQREMFSTDNVIRSDIAYINRASADECFNDPALCRKFQQNCRPQRLLQKDIHDSATPSRTSSTSGTDQEQFPKVADYESQISTTKCFYSPAESTPQGRSQVCQYRCRGAPKYQTCPTHKCKCQYLTPHTSRTRRKNHGHGFSKQIQHSCHSSPECSRNLANIRISYSRNDHSNPQCGVTRSSTKSQLSHLPELCEGSWTSSKRNTLRCSNKLDNHKQQQTTRRNLARSDGSQNSINYSKRTLSAFSIANTSKESNHNRHPKTPIITNNLMESILDVTNTNDPNYIALTVILISNDLYQINISVTHTGQSLADVYTTETALKQAERQHLFERFLTFFVLNSNFTLEQKNTILGHSFEFINTDTCQISIFKSNSNQLGNKKLQLKSKKYNFKKYVGNKLRQTTRTGINNIADGSQNCSTTASRLKGGKSKEDFENPNNTKTPKGPFISTGHYIDMSNNPYDQSAEKSDRIRNLEQQVLRLRQELNHMREELVPQEDIIKFSNLSERLRELNELLRDLRRNYQRINDSERKNTDQYSKFEIDIFGEDERRDYNENEVHYDEFETANERANKTHELHETDEPKKVVMKIDDLPLNAKYDAKLSCIQGFEETHNPDDNYVAPTSPECKKFFDDITNPRNLFERHLLMMKDFRTDAELRRQRLERKRREKMQQRQDNGEDLQSNQAAPKVSNKGRSRSTIEDEWRFTIEHVPANGEQSAEYPVQPGHYKKSQSDNSRIPLTFPTRLKKVKTVTRETQTYEFPSHPSDTELQRNQYNENHHLLPSESDTTPDPPSESVYTVSQASHDNDSQSSFDVPIIKSNLRGALQDLMRKYEKDHSTAVLTITLETNNLYHINIWAIISGKSLADIYATELAIQEAEQQRIFAKFLTYIVVSEKNTLEQKHRLLGHSYEIIKADK